jgi:hypothetical protein
MTKMLLAALVAAMLALTGLVAYNNIPVAAPVPDQVTAVEDDSCPACTAKESCHGDDACPGCPLGEQGGCCKEQLKSPCCGGDAAVKPGAATKAESKKE